MRERLFKLVKKKQRKFRAFRPNYRLRVPRPLYIDACGRELLKIVHVFFG
jgi:hypothetical protein